VLETGFPTAWMPLWSPDGKRILFGNFGGPGVSPDLWSVPVEGGKGVSTGLRAMLDTHGLGGIGNPEWAGSGLLFAAASGDSPSLWRVPFLPEAWTVAGPPVRITAGTGEHQPSASADGRIAFSTESATFDLWTLDVDASSGRTRGEPRRVTNDAAADTRPMLSAGGRRLVFLSNRNGNVDVWTRDMETGKETALTATPAPEGWPVISPDGARVAYLTLPDETMYLVPFRGGVPEKLCGDCGRPMDWAPAAGDRHATAKDRIP
jgi:Tol biopolymer transport system component